MRRTKGRKSEESISGRREELKGQRHSSPSSSDLRLVMDCVPDLVLSCSCFSLFTCLLPPDRRSFPPACTATQPKIPAPTDKNGQRRKQLSMRTASLPMDVFTLCRLRMMKLLSDLLRICLSSSFISQDVKYHHHAPRNCVLMNIIFKPAAFVYASHFSGWRRRRRFEWTQSAAQDIGKRAGTSLSQNIDAKRAASLPA